MAILKVARLGHPVLRGRAGEVDPEAIAGAEMKRILQDMADTMVEYAGVGLAAPQVHLPLRAFVMRPFPEAPDSFRVAINPRVTPLGEALEEDWEGCLSVPDLMGRVPRPARVRLEALDARGQAYSVELEGFPARVCQHEADHLDGAVFLDRMKDLSSLAFTEECNRFMRPPEPEGEKPEGEEG